MIPLADRKVPTFPLPPPQSKKSALKNQTAVTEKIKREVKFEHIVTMLQHDLPSSTKVKRDRVPERDKAKTRASTAQEQKISDQNRAREKRKEHTGPLKGIWEVEPLHIHLRAMKGLQLINEIATLNNEIGTLSEKNGEACAPRRVQTWRLLKKLRQLVLSLPLNTQQKDRVLRYNDSPFEHYLLGTLCVQKLLPIQKLADLYDSLQKKYDLAFGKVDETEENLGLTLDEENSEKDEEEQELELILNEWFRNDPNKESSGIDDPEQKGKLKLRHSAAYLDDSEKFAKIMQDVLQKSKIALEEGFKAYLNEETSSWDKDPVGITCLSATIQDCIRKYSNETTIIDFQDELEELRISESKDFMYGLECLILKGFESIGNKLDLQNSFSDYTGQLCIQATKQNDRLVLVVEDNGCAKLLGGAESSPNPEEPLPETIHQRISSFKEEVFKAASNTPKTKDFMTDIKDQIISSYVVLKKELAHDLQEWQDVKKPEFNLPEFLREIEPSYDPRPKVAPQLEKKRFTRLFNQFKTEFMKPIENAELWKRFEHRLIKMLRQQFPFLKSQSNLMKVFPENILQRIHSFKDEVVGILETAETKNFKTEVTAKIKNAYTFLKDDLSQALQAIVDSKENMLDLLDEFRDLDLFNDLYPSLPQNSILDELLSNHYEKFQSKLTKPIPKYESEGELLSRFEKQLFEELKYQFLPHADMQEVVTKFPLFPIDYIFEKIYGGTVTVQYNPDPEIEMSHRITVTIPLAKLPQPHEFPDGVIHPSLPDEVVTEKE